MILKTQADFSISRTPMPSNLSQHSTSRYPEISYLACLFLLKTRLLANLISLNNARQQAGPHLPQELLDTVKRYAVGSIISSNREILGRTHHSVQIEDLYQQIRQCFNKVKKANAHFWPAMLNPGEHLKARPETYTVGSVEEMQLKLQNCYDAFAETPGAMAEVEELMRSEGWLVLAYSSRSMVGR